MNNRWGILVHMRVNMCWFFLFFIQFNVITTRIYCRKGRKSFNLIKFTFKQWNIHKCNIQRQNELFSCFQSKTGLVRSIQASLDAAFASHFFTFLILAYNQHYKTSPLILMNFKKGRFAKWDFRVTKTKFTRNSWIFFFLSHTHSH